jgi:S-adenosylmethionine/arginine decarboxylase-like enzyme
LDYLEPKGLHIISDLIECQNIFALTNHTFFLSELKESITKNNMEDLGEMYHYFGMPYASAYSLNVMLSESHITFHTFPLPNEKNKCTMDIYTCSVAQDNGEACRNVYEFIKDIFKPEYIEHEYFIKRW